MRAKKLANIRAKLKANDRLLYGKLHNVDRLSCLIRMDNNSSIVYHNLNDIDNLSDSLIIIADKSMLDNFLKYGSDSVCMDSTFNVATNKLKLTAIVVINEFGVGAPVVFIVSNSLTTDTFEFCFNKIKLALGVSVVPNVFMSDNDNTYYNAWVLVFGKPNHKLLCTWHITKAWKQQLKLKSVPAHAKKGMKVSLLRLKKCMNVELFYKLFKNLEKSWTFDLEKTIARKRKVRALKYKRAFLKYLKKILYGEGQRVG